MRARSPSPQSVAGRAILEALLRLGAVSSLTAVQARVAWLDADLARLLGQRLARQVGDGRWHVTEHGARA